MGACAGATRANLECSLDTRTANFGRSLSESACGIISFRRAPVRVVAPADEYLAARGEGFWCEVRGEETISAREKMKDGRKSPGGDDLQRLPHLGGVIADGWPI